MRVYIASSYTGDIEANVERQLRVFDALRSAGHAPFAPLWAHFQDLRYPRDYHDWLDWCMEWVKVSDCVLRLDGFSMGADKEVELAESLKIPVYYDIRELL